MKLISNAITLATGIPRSVRIALAAIAAALFLWGAFTLYVNSRENAAVEAHKAAVEQKAAPAREQAADERLTDTITILETKEQAHDAIDKAQDVGPPSAAAIALSCARLRKLGRFSAACGNQGTDSP